MNRQVAQKDLGYPLFLIQGLLKLLLLLVISLLKGDGRGMSLCTRINVRYATAATIVLHALHKRRGDFDIFILQNH